MKKTLLFLLCVLILLCGLSTTALALEVIIDEEPVHFPDAQPFVDENGHVLIPLAAVARALDAQVQWTHDLRTAIFSRHYMAETSPYSYYGEYYLEETTIAFEVNSPTCYYFEYYADDSEGEGYYYKVEMEAAATIRDNRICAPIDYLAAAFEYEASWDADSQTMTLSPFGSADPYGYDPYDYPDYPDLEEIEIRLGENNVTSWFDFTIKDIEAVASYGDYTPESGYQLYVVLVSETCTFEVAIPMGTFDFYMDQELWPDYIWPLDPLDGYEQMMPEIFYLEPGESTEYELVFEIPLEQTGLTLHYTELDSWGYSGSTFTLYIN